MLRRVWDAEKRWFKATPPQKMDFFCPREAQKCLIFGQKESFGLGWSVQAPPPFVQVLDSRKICVAGYLSWKTEVSRLPNPKIAHFLLKNGHFVPEDGLRMLILGGKQCLLGSGNQFKPPSTLSCRC